MADRKTEKLDDTINVAVPKALKRRLTALAKAFPGDPAPTKFARLILAAAVQKGEAEGVSALGIVGQPVPADAA